MTADNKAIYKCWVKNSHCAQTTISAFARAAQGQHPLQGEEVLGHCDGCRGVTVSHCEARYIISSSPPPGVSVIVCWGIMRVPRTHFEEDNDDCSEWNGIEYNLTVPGGAGRRGTIHWGKYNFYSSIKNSVWFTCSPFFPVRTGTSNLNALAEFWQAPEEV